MINLSIDSRSTGQGKTYSLIDYVIKQFLEDKTINWLVPNRSNIEDIFIDILNHKTFIENIDSIESKIDLPEKIKNLKNKKYEDFKVGLLSTFINKINIINSFYNIDMIYHETKKNINIPKKIKKKYIKESDILIIDEVDRTLASLSLKKQIKNLYYLHLPNTFNVYDYDNLDKYYPEYDKWLSEFINNRLNGLGLDYSFFNEQLVKKLNKDLIRKKYFSFKSKTITSSNFFKNYNLDSEKTIVKKYLNKTEYDVINYTFKEYLDYLNENQELKKPLICIVENKIKESSEYKLYNEDDSQIIFFENIHNIITKLVKPNGLIVACSATNNTHVENIKQECLLVDLPYSSNIYKNPINFNLSLYKNSNYKEIGKTLIIKESKSSAYNNRFISKNKNTKITYLQDSNLVGSNDYFDYETFVFDFNFHEVKQAPCDKRLSFYSKIGNGFLKTDSDIKKLISSYMAFDSEFKQQIKNKIIQSIGRMNRGDIVNKYIYCKDEYVYIIIKDVILNNLKQNLTEL